MSKIKKILIISLCVIVGFVVVNILSVIAIGVVSDNTVQTWNEVGKTLEEGAKEAHQQKAIPKQEEATELLKVQTYILTTIENNQNLITNFNIPKKYLNGKLIGVNIYKDGFYINGITLKQWLIYVLATNKDINMSWIHNMATIEPMYAYIENNEQGIRFKLPGSQSSIIMFKEEMGELYPSRYSNKGGALFDLSITSLMNEEALKEVLDAMTILTNVSAYQQ